MLTENPESMLPDGLSPPLPRAGSGSSSSITFRSMFISPIASLTSCMDSHINQVIAQSAAHKIPWTYNIPSWHPPFILLLCSQPVINDVFLLHRIQPEISAADVASSIVLRKGSLRYLYCCFKCFLLKALTIHINVTQPPFLNPIVTASPFIFHSLHHRKAAFYDFLPVPPLR